jgi:hypothetical protein
MRGIVNESCAAQCSMPRAETKKAGSGVTDNESAAGSRLTRRDMIRRLVRGAGAGVMLAGTASAHPIYKHLADGTLLASAEAHVAAGSWKPKYLDSHQNETLAPLAERILPNSGKAQVNRFIDLLLSVDTDETREQFNNSLAAFDRESTKRFGQAFKDIPEAKQNELLTIFSTETSRHQSSGGDPWDEPSPVATPSAPNDFTLRDHFENLKTWVSGAYYSSEFGMRELGWNGVVFYPDFPGCQHPAGHV